VSTSVRDFTVTMLGYYFAEHAAEEGSADSDLGVFLRWEQLAAYARGGGNSAAEADFLHGFRPQDRWAPR
jgi:hypothetical protein